MGFIIRFSYLYMIFTYYPLLFLLLPFLCLMSLLFPASPPPHPTPALFYCMLSSPPTTPLVTQWVSLGLFIRPKEGKSSLPLELNPLVRKEQSNFGREPPSPGE